MYYFRKVFTSNIPGICNVLCKFYVYVGHERFSGMTRVYYKYAHGALIVFDLARPETFDAALSWLSDVTEKLFDERFFTIEKLYC